MTEPGTSSHIIATENGGNNLLLFRRRDAVAQGTYEQVAKARDELERGK